MAFQPVVPLSGIGGWKFLQATYDKQLQSYTNSPQVRNDRDYMIEKFSQPITVEDFLKDSRLMRATMTAFDLSGEEWKKGYIKKVLQEVNDPESTFLARLNNPKYTAFANALKPVDGKISLESDNIAAMAVRFEAISFEVAVGEVDDTMRLSLNYKSEIGAIVGSGAKEDTIAYRLMADVPTYTVVKTALNLPSDISKLPVERQAEIIKTGLKKALGVSKLSDIASPELVDKMIVRYHAMKSISEGAASYSPASAALTILGGSSYGYGSGASRNLFLSSFL
ncbi:MAG: flagellar protein [Alphaproteobacteria bacterium HGW-Alphaproteobacteria-18]|nr:MAG: flagellar protein [Alphaproteobacteria bacterium HGW-Alphaproteobacteria-18]